MPNLSDVVSVSISVADRAIDQANFGIPMVLGPTQVFAERVRTYSASTALTSMVTDGFTTSDPEYRAVAALLSNPTNRPLTIKVGRRAAANVPTQSITFTPTDLVEGKVYTITINGTEFSATADATPTATEIATALHTAINAGSEPMTSTDNTGSLTVVDDVAGAANDCYVSSGDFTVDEAGSDASVATELAAILAIDSAWYGLVLASHSTAENLAAASWANTNRKLFVAVYMDSDLGGGGSSDAASVMETAAYHYSGSMYHERPGAFPGAAWMGYMFAQQPGSASWVAKLLSGIAVSDITDSFAANLRTKTCNYYVSIGGAGWTFGGYASSGRFFDITRFVDWLEARIQENVALEFANSPKVPYTDAGIARIQSRVQEVLEQGVDVGGFAEDPRPECRVPKKADVPAADVTNRQLTLVTFSGTLAGAIHQVVPVTGTVTL